MSLARHGSGVAAGLRAFASQIHPVFMLPPLASSLFGAVLAGSLSPRLATLHLAAVFFGLYTAHVTDGYVDFHVRGEDDDHPLTVRGCQAARVGASVAFFACTLALLVLVDAVAAALTLPGWLIAVHHAPHLDTNPVGATVGYPMGVSLALLGGYYVQAGALGGTVLVLSLVFLLILAGIKIIDDAQDLAYDRSIGKRTVAVAAGYDTGRRLAYGSMAVGMIAVAVLAVGHEALPPSALGAVVAFAAVAMVAWRAGPELATMLLVRGSYLFLALLVAAVWFQPLA